MKKIVMAISVLGLINGNLFSQPGSKNVEWKLRYAKEGIVVHTRFPKINNKKGKKETVFEWKVEAEKEAEFLQCVAVLENVELHKIIFDCKTSEVVGKTDSSVIAYYYCNAPWPVPDVDIVREITSEFDTTNSSYSANHIASPDLYEDKKVRRLNISDTFFHMEKISETKTRFEFNGRFVPKGVPVFLAKTWFPEGPVKMVKSIIELSKKVYLE
jgi:hypothetical protein